MASYPNKYDKSHDGNGIQFDALSYLTFPTISVSSNQVLASVLATVSVPQDIKIQHVSIATTAASLAGQPTFQVASGSTTTLGTVGTPGVANTNGTVVFSTAQNVPKTAGTQAVYNASVPDAVNDKTLPLTLHAKTQAGDTCSIQISIAGVAVDPSPASDDYTNQPNANPANF